MDPRHHQRRKEHDQNLHIDAAADLPLFQAHLPHDAKAFPVLVALGDLLVVDNQHRGHQEHKAQKHPKEEEAAVHGVEVLPVLRLGVHAKPLPLDAVVPGKAAVVRVSDGRAPRCLFLVAAVGVDLTEPGQEGLVLPQGPGAVVFKFLQRVRIRQDDVVHHAQIHVSAAQAEGFGRGRGAEAHDLLAALPTEDKAHIAHKAVAAGDQQLVLGKAHLLSGELVVVLRRQQNQDPVAAGVVHIVLYNKAAAVKAGGPIGGAVAQGAGHGGALFL